MGSSHILAPIFSIEAKDENNYATFTSKTIPA